MAERYFPQGLAVDAAFCNREREREQLKTSIESHEHTVLVAPRRYGKTSLINQVLKDNNFPSISIDFFFVLNQKEVAQYIADGVAKIASQILPKTKTAAERFLQAISAANPKLTFNLLGQKLEIFTKHHSDKSISELLLALDHMAEEAGKSCVIVLDEFQQIGELKENHAIEAAIRHAVERSRYVSYIFCGSKRHLLNEMFSNKSRPLYHLCDLLTIDRIQAGCYEKFLQKRAKQHWQKALAKEVITEIITITENHAYYINALCRRLWRSEKAPEVKDVSHTWAEYVTQQSPWIITDLSSLTLNRKKLVNAIAIEKTKEPQGQEFLQRVSLGASAVSKSLQDLLKTDWLYQDSEGYYQLIDPAIAYFIRERA